MTTSGPAHGQSTEGAGGSAGSPAPGSAAGSAAGPAGESAGGPAAGPAAGSTIGPPFGPAWADVRLTGARVRLEPLGPEHVDGLLLAATEDRSTYGFTDVPGTHDGMVDYVRALVADRGRGEAVPFVLRDLRTPDAAGAPRIVGASRFLDLGFFRARRASTESEAEAADTPAESVTTTATTTTAFGRSTVTTTVVTATSTSTTVFAQGDATGSAGFSFGGAPGQRTEGGRGDDGPDGLRPGVGQHDGGQHDGGQHDGGREAVPSVAEIGGTWLAASAQRTSINTEAKLLLLSHAFGAWSAIRVCFKTDARNLRSRAAIERLGARYEGIRRAATLATDGGIRDSAYYSIIRAEWPGVRAGLEHRLARGSAR